MSENALGMNFLWVYLEGYKGHENLWIFVGGHAGGEKFVNFY